MIVDPQEAAPKQHRKVPVQGDPFQEGSWEKTGS